MIKETDLEQCIKSLTSSALTDPDPFMRVQFQAVINFCNYLLSDEDIPTMEWIQNSGEKANEV